MRWVLRALTDPGREPAASVPTFRLPAGSSRIVGRGASADFVLDAPLVSRLHCRLTVSGAGELEVADLDSTNGTFVNNRRVARALLAAGDRLRIGRVELAVDRE